MKAHQTAVDGQMGQNGRQIAVANKRLRRFGDLFHREPGQGLNATVAASYSHDAGHRRILPGAAQRLAPECGRAGHIGLPREHRFVVDRSEAEPFELRNPVVEFDAFERTGRGHHRNVIAWPKRRRLQHRSHILRHFVSDGLMFAASEHLTERRGRGRLPGR